MSSKKSKGPTLFINQNIPSSKAENMQKVFRNREDLDDLPEIYELDEQELAVSQKSATEIPISIEQKQLPKKQHVKPQSSFNRVKSFKEMDIEERLEYLINFPKVLPPVPCVFSTTKKKFQGYLKEHKNGTITIQIHDQSTKTIPLEELKDIIMIGIKR